MNEKENNNNHSIQKEKVITRRDFITLSASAAALVGAGVALLPFIKSLSPDAATNAVSTIEVELSEVKKGETITVMWLGSPVFVKRRTDAEIEAVRKVPLSDLKDPQKDEERVKPGKDEWLVTVGVCTHLGCVPVGGKGDYEGWYCPCHGSQYDASGRIRVGPAPENLHIPPYEFVNDTKIKIG